MYAHTTHREKGGAFINIGLRASVGWQWQEWPHDCRTPAQVPREYKVLQSIEHVPNPSERTAGSGSASQQNSSKCCLPNFLYIPLPVISFSSPPSLPSFSHSLSLPLLRPADGRVRPPKEAGDRLTCCTQKGPRRQRRPRCCPRRHTAPVPTQRRAWPSPSARRPAGCSG